jgi:DNA repair protein RecO (recombination protein O)
VVGSLSFLVMALAKDAGFLLRKIPYSESSFILKAFTRRHGLVSLMAKGARRPNSRWRGLLEPVLQLQLLFPGFSRSEIRFLGEVSLLRDFPGLREDPAKLGLARVFAEVLLRYAPSESDAEGFHDLLVAAQEGLEESSPERGALQARLASFLLGYCALSGFQPQFRVCVRCGERPSGTSVYFQMDQGGPVCSRCREGEASISLRENVLRWLDAAQRGGEVPVLGRTDAWRAEEFLLHYLGSHAGGEKRLNSVAVWHELMEDSPSAS